MKFLRRFLNHTRYVSNNAVLAATLFAGLTGVVLGFSTLSPATSVGATACKTNNIMPCGAASVSEFITKYGQNTPGDYTAIYQSYGLAPSDIDRFGRTAQMGMANRDGTITLGGKVVATNASNLGRERRSYSTPVTIAGKPYYSDPNKIDFLSNIPVMVMMNGDQFQFAAMTICGNPVKGTPTGQAPQYSCNMLHPQQIDRTTFNFTTDATALHGATVTKLVYDFGDGTSQTAANGSQVVTHKYAKDGSFTTRVTVYVAVNGSTVPVTGAQCAKPIEVKPVPVPPKPPVTPAFACSQLQTLTIDKTNRTYRFVATTAQSGGATLKDANFDFGDHQSIAGVKPSDDRTVMSEHTYAQAGTYTIVATVDFDVAGSVKSDTCKTHVSPEQTPPAECKPGIPVGDSRCTECKPGVPAGSKECAPVPELPNTSGISLGGAAVGGTGIFSASSYFLRARRNLRGSFRINR